MTHNYITKPVDTFIEEVANALKDVPEGKYLIQCKTLDQIVEWFTVRDFQELVAKCWVARRVTGDNPIWKLQKEGVISKDTYQRVWAAVEYYDQLWGLLQLAFEGFKASVEEQGENFRFTSQLDLFRQLVADDANAVFLPCLEKYYENLSSKKEKYFRLVNKVYQENLSELQRKRKIERIEELFKSITPSRHESDTFLKLVKYLNTAYKEDDAIREKLNFYLKALDNWVKREATIMHRTHSTVWKDGILQGVGYGTKKFTKV
jgi:hypothetical protein